MCATRSMMVGESAALLEGTSTPRSPRSGSRASGERTRIEILRAAKRVLATHGYAHFTLRRVANEAGLTVGNLAYHYPSKRNLVRALIMLLIEEYRAQIVARMRVAPSRSPVAFRSLVAWLMRDSASAQTSRLFREFWTIALRDPFIAKAVDRFYGEVQETASQHLRHNFPNLPPASCRAIVQLMGIISEGSNVLYGTARHPTAPLSKVTQLACSLLVLAAQQSA
ncbi:MAG TPA: TetR/AcrR family transcriptional regulator [Steroidobacteraceae bacterium]|nr:TetR/AcrR family transcriptional regulator [Steroidobacteraceae bacterium]